MDGCGVGEGKELSQGLEMWAWAVVSDESGWCEWGAGVGGGMEIVFRLWRVIRICGIG